MRSWLFAFAVCLSSPAWAVGFVSGRLGAGGARTKDAISASYNGTVRLGNNQPQWQTFVGLDLTSFKILKNKSIPDDVDGNTVTAFIGYWGTFLSFWGGYGGGQLRMYDRPDPADASPREFVTREAQLGAAINLYEAEHGQVTLNLTGKHMAPGDRFFNATGLRSIELVQLEIGFLLSNW